MSTAAARSAWLAVADAWPRDVLRPNRQFAAAIRQAADRAFLEGGQAPAEGAHAQFRQLSPVQAKKAQEAAASLRRLLENQAMKTYPATDRTTKPASFPKHYSRLIEVAEKAERGEVFKNPRLSWFRWK
ncbi:hypothetical protein JCM6882_007114 [Rhodosporidiobolus microsporus]